MRKLFSAAFFKFLLAFAVILLVGFAILAVFGKEAGGAQ